LIRPDQQDASPEIFTAGRECVAQDFEGNPEGGGRSFERTHSLCRSVESQQHKAAAQFFEEVAARRKLARCYMVTGPRLEHVRAARASDATRRSEHDGRSLIIGLEIGDDRSGAGFEFHPVAGEGLRIAAGIVAIDHLPLPLDAGRYEFVANLLKYGPTFEIVGIKQPVTGPTVETRGQLPRQIGRIFEPVVDAETIGRMRMRGVPRDEDSPVA
jgi:hypothetical protein